MKTLCHLAEIRGHLHTALGAVDRAEGPLPNPLTPAEAVARRARLADERAAALGKLHTVLGARDGRMIKTSAAALLDGMVARANGK